jgi:hypothetical protein
MSSMPPVTSPSPRVLRGVAAAAAVIGLAVVAALVMSGGSDPETNFALKRAPSAAPTSGPSGASVWVSPRGSDRGRCARGAPCRSLARAYEIAEPGEVVELAAGSYGDQVLELDPAKRDARDVTFQPAEDAEASLGSVSFGETNEDLGARHVTLRDLTIKGLLVQRTNDLTLQDVTINGSFWIQGAKDVTMRGGSVGGTEGLHADIVDWYDDCCGVEPAERVLIEDVLFHDMVMKTPQDHVECLQISGGVDIIVRQSRFVRCDTFALLAADYRTPLRGLVIEDNVFEAATSRFGQSYYSLSVRSGRDVLIRGNQSPQSWGGPAPSDVVRDWRVEENVMPNGSCDPRIVYRDNRWTSGPSCGPGDGSADADGETAGS